MTEFEKMHERIDMQEAQIKQLAARINHLEKRAKIPDQMSKLKRAKWIAEAVKPVIIWACALNDIQTGEFLENLHRKSEPYLYVRYLVILILLNKMNLGYSDVGRYLHKNHSTIMHAEDRAWGLYQRQEWFRDQFSEVCKKLDL